MPPNFRQGNKTQAVQRVRAVPFLTLACEKFSVTLRTKGEAA